MKDISWQQLDLQWNWHPCAQMKDYESFKPLVIQSAQGCYLNLADGKKVIDAISSWWCKSLGHQHPVLKQALSEQLEKFEHVIFANTTNKIIVRLAEKLTQFMPHLTKVFYAGDGSCAVEIALKMSLHARVIGGEHLRRKIIALHNGYHGETLGALSVSDVGLYRQSYRAWLFEPVFVSPVYVTSAEDPKWETIESEWPRIEQSLAPYAATATALIVEPLVQGAGGMKLYSPDFLRRIAHWAKQHGIHLIADEIMTGIGRTGKRLACEYAGIQPDFVCLGKGLTSGWIPFSTVLTTESLYQTFYDEMNTGKAFLHSHTYSGHVLGARLALATLHIMETEHLYARACTLQTILRRLMQEVADKTGLLTNLRGLGAWVAADLVVPDPHQRWGYLVYQAAVRRGALLRPLDNTIYWLPPLTISDHTLSELKEITLQAILEVFG